MSSWFSWFSGFSGFSGFLVLTGLSPMLRGVGLSLLLVMRDVGLCLLLLIRVVGLSPMFLILRKVTSKERFAVILTISHVLIMTITSNDYTGITFFLFKKLYCIKIGLFVTFLFPWIGVKSCAIIIPRIRLTICIRIFSSFTDLLGFLVKLILVKLHLTKIIAYLKDSARSVSKATSFIMSGTSQVQCTNFSRCIHSTRCKNFSAPILNATVLCIFHFSFTQVRITKDFGLYLILIHIKSIIICQMMELNDP